MKKIVSLAALVAVLGFANVAFADTVVVSQAQIDKDMSKETQQNIEKYIGVKARGAGCTTCAPAAYGCPMDCPCMPTCCPSNRGIFDGGLNKCCK